MSAKLLDETSQRKAFNHCRLATPGNGVHYLVKDVSKDRYKVYRCWEGSYFRREAKPEARNHMACLGNGDRSRDQIKSMRYEEWWGNQKGSVGSGNTFLGNLNFIYRQWGTMEVLEQEVLYSDQCFLKSHF